MEIIETPIFTKIIQSLLPNGLYQELQNILIRSRMLERLSREAGEFEN